MEISEKRHKEFYKAIDDPITDLRVELINGLSKEQLDDRLFNLTLRIHKNLVTALNLRKES